MFEKKRRLTTGEVKKILDEYTRMYHHSVYIDNQAYSLDDVYTQFLLMHDAIAAILVEHLLLGRELR